MTTTRSAPPAGRNPKAKRLEFRCPDSSGNLYLAFAAMPSPDEFAMYYDV